MAALLAVGALVVTGSHPRPRAANAASALPVMIRSAHGASFMPAIKGKRALFILALGSDARPGQSITRQRADSIHIIGVNKDRTRATILGFPRDSWVKISGGVT